MHVVRQGYAGWNARAAGPEKAHPNGGSGPFRVTPAAARFFQDGSGQQKRGLWGSFSQTHPPCPTTGLTLRPAPA